MGTNYIEGDPEILEKVFNYFYEMVKELMVNQPRFDMVIFFVHLLGR